MQDNRRRTSTQNRDDSSGNTTATRVSAPETAAGNGARTLGVVDFPELPLAQFAGHEHTRRLRRAAAERQDDRLLGALPARDALLAQLDGVLSEFEARVRGP